MTINESVNLFFLLFGIVYWIFGQNNGRKETHTQQKCNEYFPLFWPSVKEFYLKRSLSLEIWWTIHSKAERWTKNRTRKMYQICIIGSNGILMRTKSMRKDEKRNGALERFAVAFVLSVGDLFRITFVCYVFQKSERKKSVSFFMYWGGE